MNTLYQGLPPDSLFHGQLSITISSGVNDQSAQTMYPMGFTQKPDENTTLEEVIRANAGYSGFRQAGRGSDGLHKAQQPRTEVSVFILPRGNLDENLTVKYVQEEGHVVTSGSYGYFDGSTSHTLPITDSELLAAWKIAPNLLVHDVENLARVTVARVRYEDQTPLPPSVNQALSRQPQRTPSGDTTLHLGSAQSFPRTAISRPGGLSGPGQHTLPGRPPPAPPPVSPSR